MKKYYFVLLFLIFTHIGSVALAGSVIFDVDKKVIKVSNALYHGASFSGSSEETIVDLRFRKKLDGYSADSIRLCWVGQKCDDGDWAMLSENSSNYFDSSVYSEVKELQLKDGWGYSAFNLCQINDHAGRVSMMGQCVTIVGEIKRVRFIYGSYLGGALKCRPDSKCWKNKMDQRLFFISDFFNSFKVEVFN